MTALLRWLLIAMMAASTTSLSKSTATVDVRTKNGILVGEKVKTVDGVPYYAFRGVRYALAPIEILRFKNPRPVKPWSGRRQATVEGSKCTQWLDNAVQGKEDCLNLNVYTRRLGPAAKQPVMVFIFGGGYQYGTASATEVGPDFLVQNDVVLVVINYRLDVFGFLNLDNDDAPGNMGLKDQRAALQWVRDNIAAFGGDPGAVTLFGESAGASAVHYHTLVKASAGLFARAIMQSNNALTGSSYLETNLDSAAELGRQLGSASLSPRDIIAAAMKANASALQTAAIHARWKGALFIPSPERRTKGTEEKFLTRDPESLVRNPEVAPVPTIMGLNEREANFFYYKPLGFGSKPAQVAEYALHPAKHLPSNIGPYTDTARLLGVRPTQTLSPDKVAAFNLRIRQAYRLTDKGDQNFLQFYSDQSIGVGIHRLVNLTLSAKQRAPLYLYQFLEDGDFNWGKISYNVQAKGATHQDELGYLFHITSPRDLKQSTKTNSDSSKTLRLMTKLWTEFAKYGHPASAGQWPAAQGSALTAAFAKISAKAWGTLGHGLLGTQASVWDDIDDTLRRK